MFEDIYTETNSTNMTASLGAICDTDFEMIIPLQGYIGAPSLLARFGDSAKRSLDCRFSQRASAQASNAKHVKNLAFNVHTGREGSVPPWTMAAGPNYHLLSFTFTVSSK